MRDIPVIFSAPMVRALLDGRKTMTRRLAWRSETETKQMDFICDGERPDPLSRLAKGFGPQMAGAYWLRPAPWRRVLVGDRLWVRESLRQASPEGHWLYAADGTIILMEKTDPRVSQMIGWAHHKETEHASSIHMPRWASRITLIVTATKVERLQSISEDDAIAEGVYTGKDGDLAPLDISARALFADLWISLHGKESCAANPEVVALTFTVHKQNIDALPKADAA